MKNNLMSEALALFPTSRNGLRNGALVLHAVRGRPETPSAFYAKKRFGAPVYTPRGVCKNDARVRSRSGLGFAGSGALQASS